MKYRAKIEVSLKPGHTDPEGNTTQHLLKELGYAVDAVNVSKVYNIQLEAATLKEAESKSRGNGESVFSQTQPKTTTQSLLRSKNEPLHPHQSHLQSPRNKHHRRHRPATYRSQRRTRLRSKPARDEAGPSLLQGAETEPNRRGTADYRANLERTLLPQNVQGKNPFRRQRNRQPLQNLYCQSH